MELQSQNLDERATTAAEASRLVPKRILVRHRALPGGEAISKILAADVASGVRSRGATWHGTFTDLVHLPGVLTPEDRQVIDSDYADNYLLNSLWPMAGGETLEREAARHACAFMSVKAYIDLAIADAQDPSLRLFYGHFQRLAGGDHVVVYAVQQDGLGPSWYMINLQGFRKADEGKEVVLLSEVNDDTAVEADSHQLRTLLDEVSQMDQLTASAGAVPVQCSWARSAVRVAWKRLHNGQCTALELGLYDSIDDQSIIERTSPADESLPYQLVRGSDKWLHIGIPRPSFSRNLDVSLILLDATGCVDARNVFSDLGLAPDESSVPTRASCGLLDLVIVSDPDLSSIIGIERAHGRVPIILSKLTQANAFRAEASQLPPALNLSDVQTDIFLE
eukprot:4250043-Amphidinium_carterae.1